MQSVATAPPASGEAVGARLEQLLGSRSEWEVPCTLHVCSSGPDAQGCLRAIRIQPESPSGPTDLFMLRAARAQADVIVTSGRIVRSEAHLEHGLGEGPLARALHDFRSGLLGRSGPPRTLVISRGSDLPAHHPLWEDWTAVTVSTSATHVAALRARLPSHVQVQPTPEAGLEAVLHGLRAQGARRISLELGPRAVAALYAQGAVQELWSSRFEGPLPAELLGGAWPFDEANLRRWAVGAGALVDEASGPWRFQRCRVPRG